MAVKKSKPPGFTTAAILKQMEAAASGKKVRNVRGKPSGQEKQILSQAREVVSQPTRKGGIFATPPGDDAERGTGGKQEAVPDAAGSPRGGENFQAQLSRVLKRMLNEAPPSHLVGESGEKVGTNAEALAAVVQREAFAGKQWACEFWRDMVEGKPVRGAQVDNREQEVDDALDRADLAALNDMAKKGN